VKLAPEDWKLIFLSALSRELKPGRLMPNLDNDGFVDLGTSTSKLSVPEMSQLIELILAWGAQHGVVFSEQKQISDSSDAAQYGVDRGARTDTPVAEHCPQRSDAATGVPLSQLVPNWREIAIEMLAGHRDTPSSLAHRYADMLKAIGETNEQEAWWIDRLWRLVARRNKGKLRAGEFDREIEKLKAMPLALEDAA